ncbi:MAG: hypothetical protein ACE5GV_11330 [Candidatus Scalindua sp.]
MIDNKPSHFNDVAIICYVNMTGLSFERIPELESSQKRGRGAIRPAAWTRVWKLMVSGFGLQVAEEFSNLKSEIHD